MDQHRNRSIQTAGAPALGDEKPQQHPNRSGPLLRRGPPACPTAVDDELAQTASIPSGRVVTHSFEQLANVDRVIREGAVAGPALLLHPLAEAHEQWRPRHDWVAMWGHEPGIDEVMQEEASPAENLDPKCVEAYRDSRRPHFLGGWGLWDVQVGFRRRCVSAPFGW